MNDYKTGCPVYLEFTINVGYPRKGVYFVLDQDKYYIIIRDEEVLQLVSKRSLKAFEPDPTKWPAWCRQQQTAENV